MGPIDPIANPALTLPVSAPRNNLTGDKEGQRVVGSCCKLNGLHRERAGCDEKTGGGVRGLTFSEESCETNHPQDRVGQSHSARRSTRHHLKRISVTMMSTHSRAQACGTPPQPQPQQSHPKALELSLVSHSQSLATRVRTRLRCTIAKSGLSEDARAVRLAGLPVAPSKDKARRWEVKTERRERNRK